MTQAADILTRATALGWTISTAESCTGGMVAVALTDLPGSSAIFEKGFVTYSNQAKIDMLGVNPETLAAHGAVSEQVAREMADGAAGQSGAEIAIAISGIAGPGGSDHKPEGRVCFAWSVQGILGSETVEFGPLGRSIVRESAAAHALSRIAEHLKVA